MRFNYRAVDEEGALKAGELEAPSLTDAATGLRDQGLTVLELRPADPVPPQGLEGIDAFVFFNQSLAELTRAGIPLGVAVGELARTLKRGKLKRSLDQVEGGLREGRPLDEALIGGDFPTHYRWLVKAGLAAGRLPAVLTSVAVHAQVVRKLRRGIARTLAYPAIVLILGITIASVLVSVVLPLYQALEKQWWLPESGFAGLKIVVGSAAGLLLLIIGAVVGAVIARRRPGGERFLWRLPGLGRLLRDLCLERFFASLQIQIESRVPLVDAVPVAALASGSAQLVAAGERIRRDLEQAKSLSSILQEWLPRKYAVALREGESSGRMAEAVSALRQRISEESESVATGLLMVLEPSAILVTGALMAGVYITLLSPYLDALHHLANR